MFQVTRAATPWDNHYHSSSGTRSTTTCSADILLSLYADSLTSSTQTQFKDGEISTDRQTETTRTTRRNVTIHGDYDDDNSQGDFELTILPDDNDHDISSNSNGKYNTGNLGFFKYE